MNHSLKKRALLRPLALSIALLLAAPQAGVASIGSDMENFYNSLGGTASASGPQLYRGQSASYFSAGSMNARVPIRNFNPVSIQMPSIRAGCGGIDLFLGGFSFINSDQLINMLQNIGSNAVGYAFQLALATISPTINGVLGDLRSAADKVNSMNINTCQAGMEVVKGAAMLSGAQKSLCESLATDSGDAKDYAQARFMCQDTTYANKILNQANAGTLASTSGSNPAKTVEPLAGNIVWRALMKDPALAADKETARLIMSMTGTLVLYSPPDGGGATNDPVPFVPLVDYQRLLTAISPDNSEVYTCTDGEEGNQCRFMAKTNVDLSTLRQKIEGELATLIDKVVFDDGSGGVLNASEQFILTRTGFPVIKLVQTVADVNPTLATAVMQPYTDAIVADVVYSYFRTTLMAVETALHQNGTGTEEQRELLRVRIRSLQVEAQRDRNAEIARVGGMEEVITKINLYQKALASGMTITLQQRLAFARTMEKR